MRPWFYQFIPYFVLIVFHFTTVITENLEQTACIPEEASKTRPVVYCPPGALFGPLHFSDYPLKPEYWELTVKETPCPVPLAQKITPQTAFHKDTWCKQPAPNICVKYNCLPAYQTDMEATPKPKPDCLPPTPGLTPPTANQYAGISYITLAELVNTMVLVAGPWALVGQSASYLIKLAPLLWWALPSSQQIKLAAEANKPSPGTQYPDTHQDQAAYLPTLTPKQPHIPSPLPLMMSLLQAQMM
ncbi:hypothetical protein DSO57_1026828 [Entomophthora muscae]|uniref:Uncharacterized protein n=1 Tax=Entomophthora muscae TaxID=34485 RepID=A0ACC2RGM1_9FUNG|nr:hypothetical protein DSO57_1026828 [Entomophthora muscae]